MANNLGQPVLILGFHHSGTRMLAEVLGMAGLFQVGMGLTYEWKYMQDLNDRIWESWWDLNGISNDILRERAARIDKGELLSKLQEQGYEGGIWGFKDPRTCTTLATWLQVFPQAKAVHIIRDPRDVLGTLPGAYSKFTPGRKIPQQALEHWCQLWTSNLQNVRALGADRACYSEVRYEDLCARPKQEFDRLINEVRLEDDLDLGMADLSKVRSKEKKYLSWLDSAKLSRAQVKEIEKNCADVIENLGYN